MSISSVITGGFGAPGSASLVITDGYSTVGVAPVVVATTPSGVGRRVRFLRRAPRLPWEDVEQQESPETPQPVARRKRIRLPDADPIAQEHEAIATAAEFNPARMVVPEVPKRATHIDPDEDDFIVLNI